MTKTLVALALVWLTVLATQMVSGAALLADQPAPPGGFGWLLAADALVATALLALTGALPRRRSRAWVTFCFWAGLSLTNLLETVFFELGLGPGLLSRLLLQQSLVAVSASWVAHALAGPGVEREAAPVSPAASTWPGRLLACAACYAVFYLAAGMLVYPFVQSYYESRARPELSTVLLVASFRGLVFSALAGLLAGRLEGGRWRAIGLVALGTCVLGGAASLLSPNPYMPDDVRWAHFVEVAISNAAFGAVATWILTRPARPPGRDQRDAVAR